MAARVTNDRSTAARRAAKIEIVSWRRQKTVCSASMASVRPPIDTTSRAVVSVCMAVRSVTKLQSVLIVSRLIEPAIFTALDERLAAGSV